MGHESPPSGISTELGGNKNKKRLNFCHFPVNWHQLFMSLLCLEDMLVIVLTANLDNLINFAILFDLWCRKVQYLKLGRAGLALGPYSAFTETLLFCIYICSFLNDALLYSSVTAELVT